MTCIFDKSSKLSLEYKKKNINKLEIYIGNYSINNDSIIFNKNIDKEKYDLLFSKFINYKSFIYNQTIYNYNNNYLYITNLNNKKTYQYFKKLNINKIKNNSNLILFYNEKHIDQAHFSCLKHYNKYNIDIIEFNINDYFKILFCENEYKQLNIKININLNHNIDNTIHLLKKIFIDYLL